MKTVALAAALSATTAIVVAKPPPVPVVDRGPHRVTPASSTVSVDGTLSEPAWREAWTMELGFEVRPGEKIPPPVRTEVLATYDRDAVYFAFRAFDPDPQGIRAHLADRDEIGPDDWVLVVLDTFNDERRSFCFMVNPLGVQSDFVETESGNGHGGTSWDTIWESAGRITEWGYAVEMRIPFSSLRFQHVDGPQTWGFDAVRSYPRSVRHHIGLFPRDRSTNCYLCQAVKIQGFDGVSPGKNLELVPTLTATRTDERDELPDGALMEGGVEADAGLTARWGVTPNMTLSGTVNPDFSQVEADARQLDVNERFALFFPEKRPFFMEGADFFETRLRAVYTRTLHDPNWGAKLTGKARGHTVGAYVVQDAVTNLLLPGPEGSDGTTLEEDSLAGVLRYKRDAGRRLTVGAMLTARQGDAYHNHLAGFDSNLRLTDTDRLQLQVLGSSTDYPDERVDDLGQPRGGLEDWAADLIYVRDTRTWDLWSYVRHVGGDFRADLGFMPKADFTTSGGGVSREWFPDGRSWYSRLEAWAEVAHEQVASTGELLLDQANIGLTYEGPLQSHSVIKVFRRRQGYGGLQFDLADLQLHHCMKPNGHSHVFVNLWWGDQVDYDNVRLGRRLRVQPGVFYNLGRHLSFNLEHLYERMTVDGGHLYTANISQGALAYQFSTRTFLRLILQYEHDRFSPSRYDDPGDLEPERDDLFAQVLFSYTVNPQTVFFLGYTEGREGGEAFSLTTSARTVFAKVGYAFSL